MGGRARTQEGTSKGGVRALLVVLLVVVLLVGVVCRLRLACGPAARARVAATAVAPLEQQQQQQHFGLPEEAMAEVAVGVPVAVGQAASDG